MKKKLLSVVLAVAMAATMLAGCGGQAASADAPEESKTEQPEETADAAVGEAAETVKEGGKVTALFFSLEGEYFTILDTLLKEGLESKGYSYESQSSNMDPVTMIEQIENAVAGGTDALWIWAISAEAIKDACKAAKDQGVVVYNFVTDPGVDARTVFRGADNEACGRAIGEMAIEWADKTYGADAAEGTIKAILMGDPNSDQNKVTFEALQQKIAEDARFEVLEAVGINTSTIEAQSTTENMFSKYGEIDAIITCGGEMAIGVASYLQSESSAVADPTSVGVFGTEINEETAKLMKDGILKGTVSNGGLITENIATQVEQLDALLKGETPEGVDENNFSQVSMGKITLENMSDYGF